MSENKHTEHTEEVRAVSELLTHYDAENTVALNVAEVCSFTDYLVITTARSMAHLRGLHRRVEEHLGPRDIHPINSHKRSDENGWTLLDYGFMIIHLMTEEMREFYELERLWFNGEIIYDDRDAQDTRSV